MVLFLCISIVVGSKGRLLIMDRNGLFHDLILDALEKTEGNLIIIIMLEDQDTSVSKLNVSFTAPPLIKSILIWSLGFPPFHRMTADLPILALSVIILLFNGTYVTSPLISS